jgi:hypothetical protein
MPRSLRGDFKMNSQRKKVAGKFLRLLREVFRWLDLTTLYSARMIFSQTAGIFGTTLARLCRTAVVAANSRVKSCRMKPGKNRMNRHGTGLFYACPYATDIFQNGCARRNTIETADGRVGGS